MEKKKVVLFIRGFHNGGIEKVFELYYSHMSLEPFEIHIVTHMKNDPNRKKFFEDMGCMIHEFSPIRGHKIKRKNVQEYYHFFNKYDFDVVHNNMPDILLPLFFAKRKNVPIRILHAHSVYSQRIKSKSVLYIYEMGFALNVKMATMLLTVSDKAAKSAFLKQSGRAIILPNAIENEKYRFNQETREALRTQLGLNNTLVLGHVGRYENDEKNQEFIFRIFEELCKTNSKFRLLLIGDGKFKPLFVEKSKQLGLDDKIIFTGIVGNVNDYLMAMDLFLFPSKQEGLGIAAIEAQTTGLPCIISDLVPKEVKVTENVTFLPICGEKVEMLWIEAIQQYMDIINSLDRENAVNQVINAGYDIESQAIKLVKIYLNEAL